MMRIRVLLVDDHATVRQGLRLVLESQADMEVVGEAEDGSQAVERAKTHRPAVVVLDVSMPKMNGLEAAKALKAQDASIGIVALTRYDDDAYARALFGAGASAYVLKQSASSELLRAIRACAAGDRYTDASLLRRMEGSYYTGRTGDGSGWHRVSDRENAVLREMAIGLSNKEIAAELAISVKTVEVHKANAMRKLGLRGRIDVVRYAALQGWLRDP